MLSQLLVMIDCVQKILYILKNFSVHQQRLLNLISPEVDMCLLRYVGGEVQQCHNGLMK